MTSLSFSTDPHRFDAENLLRLVRHPHPSAKSQITTMPFPQLLPHPNNAVRNPVFIGMAAQIHFCTGSTTNTKNMNQRFCVVVVIRRQHAKEVRHAIQR